VSSRSKIFEELSFQKINEIVEQQFGKTAGIDILLLKGGLFNTTYKLTLYSPYHELILRVGPVNEEYLLPFELNLMNAESRVYDLLAQKHIPCPTVLVCDSTKSIINRDYMITEFIRSVPLSDETIPEDAKTVLYEQIGERTAMMHSIVGSKFGRVSDIQRNGGYDSWGDFLLAQAIEIGEKCCEYNVFDNDTVNRIIGIYENNSWLYKNITIPRLVHSDLWAGNVLVRLNNMKNKYELAAIIDADRALFGDIDFEFASPWIINESFIKGYGDNAKHSDANQQIKVDTYKLIFSFIDSFVWKVKYDNMVEYEINKLRTNELLKSLEAKLNG
jgi:aminoglycoside phosphotransferase (APT) family kinase protein